MEKNKGITLIALVITIIVLLILAGVTIATLTGDNGLLQKATTAKEETKSAEAEEQIKLIYAEYQISKYAEGNMSAGDYLKEQLEKTYGEGNVDLISSEESIVLKVIENGESKFYEYNPSTGISKELQKGINYNGKTASEIRPGDDITIVTEKFKVFAVENNTIKAMPYYNITLTDTPVQSKDAGTIAFSTRPYWSTDENGEEIENWSDKADEINMNDPANNIQQYITKYKETLKDFGVDKIDLRAAKYSEIKTTGVTAVMVNPGHIGIYWIGSGYPSSSQHVYYVTANGAGIYGHIYGSKHGVRPIIEIPIE